MAQVNTSGGTSFSELKSAYVAGGLTDASGNSSLRDGSTTSAIDVSDFRNANFTDGTSIPGAGSISIATRFLDSGTGRTFGSAATTFYLKITNDGQIMESHVSFFVQIRGNSGDDVNSAEVHYGAESAVTLEIVDDSTPTSGITINFVGDNISGPDLTDISLSGGMSGSITYTEPGSGGATSITFAATGSSESPLTMGISAK